MRNAVGERIAVLARDSVNYCLRDAAGLLGFPAIRRFAISQYSATQSMPMNALLERRATTAVVPLPMNGSKTTPSGGQLALTQVLTSDSGKTAK